MTYQIPEHVRDVTPWRRQQEFKSTETWWKYVLTLDEKERIDQLVGLALLNQEACDLLLQNDETIFRAFQFSDTTYTWLMQIQARSLHEFAQVVISRLDKLDS